MRHDRKRQGKKTSSREENYMLGIDINQIIHQQCKLMLIFPFIVIAFHCHGLQKNTNDMLLDPNISVLVPTYLLRKTEKK